MKLVGDWFGQHLDMNVRKIEKWKDKYHDEIILVGDGLSHEYGETYSVVGLHIDRKKVGTKILYEPEARIIVTKMVRVNKGVKEEITQSLRVITKGKQDEEMENYLYKFFKENNALLEVD